MITKLGYEVTVVVIIHSVQQAHGVSQQGSLWRVERGPVLWLTLKFSGIAEEFTGRLS